MQHFSATTPALTHLDLSENYITAPPPAWPETMQRLKLSHNKLTHLGRLPDSVGQLNADDNLLVELPNPPPKNLRFIDISHNQLRRLFDPEKALLQVLKADHNLINTVPAAFSRKECDTRLWLSDNPLTEETKNRLRASNRAISAFDSALPRIVL
ncbi:hypothetical protein AAH678_20885 [Sodalis endosymbiont of Spalangia cameroni]|uniref:hypothetical protein n=1 Tax=Sodalis praecaptivus TaxID=1239307 RepID=UPI0031F98B57